MREKQKNKFCTRNIVALLSIVSLIASTTSIPSSYSSYAQESPLKQTKDGVHDSEIKCLNKLVLIFKTSDLTPACVRQSSVPILIARGWFIPTTGNVTRVQDNSRNYNLAFLVNYDNPQYNKTVTSIIKHLKSGDYLMIEGYDNSVPIEQDLQKIKLLVNSGVNVGAIRIYNNIDALTNNVPNLPRGFDYIGYDYEGGDGFSPEFTTNETRSIEYFDQAEDAVHKYDEKTGSSAKLLVAPPYGELKDANWNWGLAAQHVDMINIQFQTFIQNTKFLDYVLDAIAQIKQESPSTKVFVQLSLVEKRGTAQDNLNAINTIRMLPIDAFLMFYHTYQTSELEQFLKIVPQSS